MEMERDHRSSLLGALDPRALILCAGGAAFCFSAVHSLATATVCLALSAVLAAFRRTPLLPLLKQMAVVNVFILFIWLTVPLTMPGESVAAVGPLSWSGEGVTLAALVTLKCNAIVLTFVALVSGMDLPLIGCALERLRAPAKLVFLFLFTCRYIHVIADEWHKLRTAAELRGFVPSTSLHTYGTIGSMLGLTFINGIDRSRRIYEAMLLRGFDGTFHTVAELKSSLWDKAFTVLFFAALGGLLAVDVAVR